MSDVKTVARAGEAAQPADRRAEPARTPQQDLEALSRAIGAAMAAYRLSQQTAMAAIPGKLAERIEKARRGSPDKLAKREREARRWAETAQVTIAQALADREAEAALTIRAAELAYLEGLRGNDVVREVRNIETPILKNGAPIWRRGKISTKSETVVRPRVTNRDGLETLARSNLTVDGETRLGPDRKPMPPAISPLQYAAGMRYREAYEQADPERSLKAMDMAAAGGGRSPDDPFGRRAMGALARRVDVGRQLDRLDRVAQAAAGHDGVLIVRAVAGLGLTVASIAPSGRRNRRMAAALLDALDALAEHMGLC
jgi:hypothetical protein